MPPPSKFRLFAGWIKELFWILLVLVSAPIGVWWPLGSRRGTRSTPVILATDLAAHPLVYLRLRAALARAGFPVLINRSTNPFRSLREHSRSLARRLEEWNVQNGILIGHGMGSLVALSLPDSARRRVQHLVSLGTAFHGSRVYLPLSFLPTFRDMAVGSEYLLLNRVNALLFPGVTPFVAWRNQWIVPQNLAHFGQGRDLILDEVGHYNLVLSGEVIDTVIGILTGNYADVAAASGTPAAGVPDSVTTKQASAESATSKSPQKTATSNRRAKPKATQATQTKKTTRKGNRQTGRKTAKKAKSAGRTRSKKR